MPTISKPTPSASKSEWPETPRSRLTFRQNTIFESLLQELVGLSLSIIEDIYNQYPESLTLPLGSEPIENYLSGFEIQFVPIEKAGDWDKFPHFCHPLSDGIVSPRFVEGFWHLDDTKRIVFIFFRTSSAPGRQRFTVIHELFHACQYLDPLFRTKLDHIYETSSLPKEAIIYLLERATDKATANYLMPAQIFQEHYSHEKDITRLSKLYGVSQASVKIRVHECCRPRQSYRKIPY